MEHINFTAGLAVIIAAIIAAEIIMKDSKLKRGLIAISLTASSIALFAAVQNYYGKAILITGEKSEMDVKHYQINEATKEVHFLVKEESTDKNQAYVHYKMPMSKDMQKLLNQLNEQQKKNGFKMKVKGSSVPKIQRFMVPKKRSAQETQPILLQDKQQPVWQK